MSEAKSKLINCLVETLGRTKTENWWCKRERVLQIATYIRENLLKKKVKKGKLGPDEKRGQGEILASCRSHHAAKELGVCARRRANGASARVH